MTDIQGVISLKQVLYCNIKLISNCMKPVIHVIYKHGMVSNYDEALMTAYLVSANFVRHSPV